MNFTHPEAFKIVDDQEIESKAILSPGAQQFLIKLHRKFNQTRLQLLKKRVEKQFQIDQGETPDFLQETVDIRENPDWKVAPAPLDLEKRWVEITGPTDRKMIINALNSGADIFMADFEDANSPTWKNMLEGQSNLVEAVAGTLSYENPDGKKYALKEKVATIMVRPRGWHLEEKHVLIDGEPISASLFDFGLTFFHNAHALIKKKSGPYYYLPKLENHHEASLWNDVFLYSQEFLGLPSGTIRATVLIETILAVFEMEEILYEMREHITGLNAGRWDYIFSIIKKFQKRPDLLFPDRIQISMKVPFMHAYAMRLVETCHKRGAHAIGGMAAFIPSRKDRVINENAFAKVREDKLDESKMGFDGTWVAHPDLVLLAREVFASALNDQPHQKKHSVKKNKFDVEQKELIVFKVPGGAITENGIRHNISVSLQYLQAWLSGIGAVAIFNLMEDAATAEISRAQLWQWLHHENATLADGRPITQELYRTFVNDEMKKIEATNQQEGSQHNLLEAKQLLDQLVLNPTFADFLTLSAYDKLY